MGNWTSVDPAIEDDPDQPPELPELPEPAALDTFEPVDICDAPRLTLTAVDGVAYELVCEVEGAHDEHEATLRWKTVPDEPEGDDG